MKSLLTDVFARGGRDVSHCIGRRLDRFVAFVWNQESDTASRQAAQWCEAVLRPNSHPNSRWSIVTQSPGLRVLVLADERGSLPVAQMAASRGVVIGSLFERGREQAGPIRNLETARDARIVATRGGHLIANYWGSYVACWREGDRVEVLRDPCGSVSCFITRANEVDILCSYVPDIAELPGLRFSIDWDSVGAFLLHNYFVTEFTGLKEIRELLPGQRITWSASGSRVFSWMWSCADLASEPKRQECESAKDELRQIAETCFTAWGKCADSIVVRLSGGLDSSIVANLVRRTSAARVRALHFVGQGYDAFELKLARLAAQNADIELMELEVGAGTLFPVPRAPKLARPTRQLLGAAADALVNEAVGAAEADTVMAGHGGDGLFLQRSIAGNAPADCLTLAGLGREFWRITYDTAVLTEQPIWQILRRAVAFRFGLKRWNPLDVVGEARGRWQGLVGAERLAALPPQYMSYPWLQQVGRLPPCKAEQVRSIAALHNYYPVVGHAVHLSVVHPFVSQPLVEWSLRTSADLFGRGGIDRALERAAFSDILPVEIARRTQKGFVSHSLIANLARDVGALRGLILGGVLVEHGIVNPAEVERRLNADNFVQETGPELWLDLIAAEVWLSAWLR